MEYLQFTVFLTAMPLTTCLLWPQPWQWLEWGEEEVRKVRERKWDRIITSRLIAQRVVKRVFCIWRRGRPLFLKHYIHFKSYLIGHFKLCLGWRFLYPFLQYSQSPSVPMVCFDVLLRFPSSPGIAFQHFIWTAVYFSQDFWNWTWKPRTRTYYREIHFSLLLKCGVSRKELCCLLKTSRDYLKGDFTNKENLETYNP